MNKLHNKSVRNIAHKYGRFQRKVKKNLKFGLWQWCNEININVVHYVDEEVLIYDNYFVHISIWNKLLM